MFDWIDNTYLGKLFQVDRKLSFCVGGFFLLTVIFNLLRLEATPFFLWGMYSAIETPESTYDVPGIRVGGTGNIDLYTGLSDNSRYFLFSPVQYYKELKENNDIDIGLSILQKKFPSSAFFRDKAVTRFFDKNTETRPFPAWYASFIAAQTGKKVDGLTVTNLSARFLPRGKMILDSSHVFLKWP